LKESELSFETNGVIIAHKQANTHQDPLSRMILVDEDMIRLLVDESQLEDFDTQVVQPLHGENTEQ
jgi:hypothetical protein